MNNTLYARVTRT